MLAPRHDWNNWKSGQITHYFCKKACCCNSLMCYSGWCLSVPDFSVEILRRNQLELVIVQDEWTLYLSKQLQSSIRLSLTSVERCLMKYYTKSIHVLQRIKQVAKENEVNASCNSRVFLPVFCSIKAELNQRCNLLFSSGKIWFSSME